LSAPGTRQAAPSRFEYRVFAPRLEPVARELREHCEEEGRELAVDLYLVGERADRSVKVRDGCVEVKALRERRGELERWEPTVRLALPLAGEWVRRTLADHLGVDRLDAPRKRYAFLALLSEVAAPTPDVEGVCVQKDRQHFSADGARVEFARIELDGSPVETVAVESLDPDATEAWVRRLGLDRWPNQSFVRRIREERTDADETPASASRVV
jgi:hypothetical protein